MRTWGKDATQCSSITHTGGTDRDDEEPAPFSAQSGSGLSLLAGWFSPTWLNPAPLELDRHRPNRSSPDAPPPLPRASERAPSTAAACLLLRVHLQSVRPCLSLLSRTFVIPVSCAQPSSRPRYPARQRLGVCLPRRQVVVVVNHHLPD